MIKAPLQRQRAAHNSRGKQPLRYRLESSTQWSPVMADLGSTIQCPDERP